MSIRVLHKINNNNNNNNNNNDVNIFFLMFNEIVAKMTVF